MLGYDFTLHAGTKIDKRAFRVREEEKASLVYEGYICMLRVSLVFYTKVPRTLDFLIYKMDLSI